MAELEKLLCTDSKVESLKKINAIIENGGGGTGLQMFDTILKDHVLTYEESKGLALQGTYVYKEALAGSRYGYPDFYAKCLEEKEAGTATEVTLGSSTITMYIASNGHQYYDIANKDVVDNFFNTMGSAWFYGVDTENERIFLPRNNYFDQATGNITEVGKSVEAGLPNIEGAYHDISYISYGGTGAFKRDTFTGTSQLSGGSATGQGDWSFNASRSNPIYGNSDTVQPNAVKKLLYICVGNTTNYEGMTEVVNQGMEILEQVNQGLEARVNLDATNLSNDGKKIVSNLSFPSNKSINLTLGASGTKYTAPANGWVFIQLTGTSTAYNLGVLVGDSLMGFGQTGTFNGFDIGYTFPVTKGMTFAITYANVSKKFFKFIYAQGSESEA